MNYRPLAFFFFWVLCSSAYSQSNFRKGYIVSLKGDTLKGYIDYRESARNPTRFRFKSLLEEKDIQYYTSSNGRKIVIEGYDQFERFEVVLSMNEIDYNKIEPCANPIKKKDIVFLKVITRGDRINLYSYRDELKDRFFILAVAQTTPEELEFKVQRRDDQLSAISTYRIQLDQIASRSPNYTPALKNLIELAPYSMRELKKIAERINTSNEKEATSTTKIYKRGRFILSAGVNYSGITYKGQTLINADGLDNNGNPAWRAKTTTHSFLPAISLGYDLFFHPAIQRSYVRTELSITGIRSKVTSLYKLSRPYTEELTNKYDLSGVFVSFTPQLMYNIYHQRNLGLYIGGGLSVRYSFYPSQTLYQYTNKEGPGYSDQVFENYFTMKSLNVVATSQVGAIINRKIGISLMSNFPSELKDNYNSTKLFMQERSLRFNVSYFF